MLNKDRISGIEILSPEWDAARLAKLTSSGNSALISERGEYTVGFMSYIYDKVGEELTGRPAQLDPIDTDATRWGLQYENEALRKFQEQMKIQFLVLQKWISVPGTRFGSTPDALIPHNESVDGKSVNVSTVEVKCYPTFKRYIALALCKTPQEVRKADPKLYWQVLDQMDNCDCLIGYSVAYHPEFKTGNLSIVEFRKVNLLEDFKFLKQRKKMATDKFDEVREELIKLGKH